MLHLAFDIGNVLCTMNFGKFLTATSFYKKKNAKFEDYEFLEVIQARHDIGLSTMEQELKTFYNVNGNRVIISNLLEIWNKSLTFNEKMLDLLESRLSRGDKIALVSNIGKDHAEFIRANILNRFKSPNLIEFFSCDVGARKPSFLYYKTFLSMYPEFDNCLYIDDKPENLTAGKRFGFRPVLFNIEEDLTGSIDKLTKEISYEEIHDLDIFKAKEL